MIIIGDSLETNMSDRRPIEDWHTWSETSTCFIGDPSDYVWSEYLQYSNINKQKVYKNKYI